MTRVSVLVAVVASLCVGVAFLPLLARAQAPAPPPGYEVVAPEVVLEPLLAAAEADLGRGDAALALARAAAVTAALPPDGATHVRAEGLILLARQRLAGAPAADVPPDVALAPLVDAAAIDGPAGRSGLARARLEFVLGRVAAGSALGVRAAALRSALDASAASAALAPPVGATTPTAPVQPYTPTYATPTYVYTAPAGTPPVSPDVRLARGQTPDDPHRRGDAEIVELYITGGIFGAYVGAWIPFGSGALSHSPGEEIQRVLIAGTIIGAGVFALGVFGLDQIDRGLRTGVPAGISMGIRFGLGLGALTLGIYGGSNSVDAPTVFNVVGFSALGGGALGAALAMGLEPHPSQVQFTQTAGLWGALYGAQLATLIAPLIPLDGGFRDNSRREIAFGIITGGLSAGILTGLIMSAAHANPSARRSWHLTLGFLAGTGAGTALWALASALSSTLDAPSLGGSMLVGATGGLIISGLLSSGDRERANWDEDPAAVPDVQVSIAPMPGGGSLGLAGTF